MTKANNSSTSKNEETSHLETSSFLIDFLFFSAFIQAVCEYKFPRRDYMAQRYAPFKITYTFTGKKTSSEISNIYHDFYLRAISQNLNDSNISDIEKKEIVDRLINHHSQTNPEK
jgi:hypothetical protein